LGKEEQLLLPFEFTIQSRLLDRGKISQEEGTGNNN
jgi:hypothetical protein